MKIVFLQQDFNGQQDSHNEKTAHQIAELEKKASLFKAYTQHDGLKAKLDDYERKMETIEACIQIQQEQIDKSLLKF